MRIKIPGSRKIKSAALAVCAVIAVAVIVTAGINNKKEKQIMQTKIEQQQKEEKEAQEKIKKEIAEMLMNRGAEFVSIIHPSTKIYSEIPL